MASDRRCRSPWLQCVRVANQQDNTAGGGSGIPRFPSMEEQGVPIVANLDDAADIRWWRPGWADMWRHIGYRWLLLLPVVFLLALASVGLCLLGFEGLLLLLGFKLLLLTGGIVISLGGWFIRRAVQARREPFCIFCGYNLTGLPEAHTCPECGRSYTWDMIREYRRDPHWFIERWKAQRKFPPPQGAFPAGAVPRKRPAADGTE